MCAMWLLFYSTNASLTVFSFLITTDFLRGVTYRETSDPLLQKIYQKEGVQDDDTPDELKPVDPRQELFAAIRSRRQG